MLCFQNTLRFGHGFALPGLNTGGSYSNVVSHVVGTAWHSCGAVVLISVTTNGAPFWRRAVRVASSCDVRFCPISNKKLRSGLLASPLGAIGRYERGSGPYY